MNTASAPPSAPVLTPRRTGSGRQAPWCALVGAGPDGLELVSLEALRLMRRATLLLVDDLVSDAVLALMPALVLRGLGGRAAGLAIGADG